VTRIVSNCKQQSVWIVYAENDEDPVIAVEWSSGTGNISEVLCTASGNHKTGRNTNIIGVSGSFYSASGRGTYESALKNLDPHAYHDSSFPK
jgi:hypothetical protein